MQEATGNCHCGVASPQSKANNYLLLSYKESCKEHHDFVDQVEAKLEDAARTIPDGPAKTAIMEAIVSLLSAKCIEKTTADKISICSPLGVVEQKKLRLILDLRYLNKHLMAPRFKYEDISTLRTMFETGEYFFSFDLKSAYHHIDIDPRYHKYLGFKWRGELYTFTVLPFGLCTAPHVFTKITRDLVHWWRRNGHKLFMYLDDGAGAESSQTAASKLADIVRADILKSGFILSEKSRFTPSQQGDMLGFHVDLAQGTIKVTVARVEKLSHLLTTTNLDHATAREVAKIAGSIISMSPAFGTVTRLQTRAMYEAISTAASWEEIVHATPQLRNEITFWSESFHKFHGRPLRPLVAASAVLTWSDASETGWGGYSVSKLGTCVARGPLPPEVRETSSTLRELIAVRYVILSLLPVLSGCEVIHRSDNQAAVAIIASGSKHPHLHDEALALFRICIRQGITFRAEWIPREENERADFFSKVKDQDDWQLAPDVFLMLDRKWGPHTIDRFATPQNAQMQRFCSRWWSPGCTSVDAFSVSWNDENNWIEPPIHLIGRTIRHMQACHADGTLILPFWPSATWWPLLWSPAGFRDMVVDHMVIPPRENLFISAPQHIPGWTALEQLAKEDSAIGKLMHLLPKVMLCGHAPSTVQTYARGFNRWHAFASSASLTAFPADGLHVGLYLVHLLLSSSSPAPVATAVASISWVHQKATLPDLTRHACVAQCHRAVQRLLARPVKPKKALVSTEVQRIIEHYSDSSTSLDDLQTITLIVLGFSAMLRWDELHRLTPSDISFTDTHMVISLQQRKNDQFRKGHQVYIARSGLTTCPVELVQRFLTAGKHLPHQPLFCRLGSCRKQAILRPIAISYSCALEKVRKCLAIVGLDPKEYGLHSMRSGAASTAASAGTADRLIKRHGGWKSDSSKNRYIEESLPQLLQLSQSLGL
ncbi:uncharacterized protein LOC135826722 [Sycon ciliatum]|uniref:uncharacterized protein LOC135826722 n=1 Tax=Sycon ciliatum TaxID=27933 RepID=UPI0031F683B7